MLAMDTILVTLTVDSFDHFLQTFETRGLPLRERHGSRGARVMRHADDAERVSVLFDWDADAFAGFLADPEVQASMKAGGTLGPPQIQLLAHPVALAA
jgi:heme-degrading monooxygenase HmoA